MTIRNMHGEPVGVRLQQDADTVAFTFASETTTDLDAADTGALRTEFAAALRRSGMERPPEDAAFKSAGVSECGRLLVRAVFRGPKTG